jgi:hypothetical protein
MIRIYGASDDLVEVDADVRDEFNLGRDGTRLRLTAPDGQSLDVVAQFCPPGDARLDWTLAVEAHDSYPSWPVRFTERPDYEGDPAVEVDAPEGTTVTDVTPED